MNSKIFKIAMLLVVGLASCKTDEIPPGVLDKVTFAEVLVDMYVSEARLTNLPLQPDSSIKLVRPFEEAILLKKGISDSIMRITYAYYVAHPIELEEAYDIAIDTMSLREQKSKVKPK